MSDLTSKRHDGSAPCSTGADDASPTFGGSGGVRRREGVLVAVAAVLFITVIGLAVYKAWPLLYPSVGQTAVVDPTCDLRQGPCSARFPSGGRVRFGIDPMSIPLVTPLRLQVDIEGLEPISVQVDFAGVDMNMGYNRVTLSERAPGLYEGQGTLPVCVRDRMDWEARVLIETAQGLVAAPYRFSTWR